MFSLLRNKKALSLLLAASLTILSNALISPALPGIREAFKGSPNVNLLVPLLITAPSIMVAVFAQFAGILADRFNRRNQLVIGVLMFAITGSAGLYLNSLTAILISRLLLGISVALVMTAQTALIGRYFKGPARNRFMGLQIAATNFSGLAFILLSGWLASSSPFWPFAIYLVALLYIPLMWVSLTEPVNQKEEVPMLPTSGDTNWVSTLIIVAVLAILSLMGFYIIPTQLPFYLAEIGHPDPTVAGAILAALTLAGGIVSLLYSSVRVRLGRAYTAALGFGLFASGFGVIFLADGLFFLFVATLLIGSATGLLFPIFLSIALDVAPPKRHGLASGTVTTAIFLGQFLSPLASQPLIENIGFENLFALVAGLYLILGLVASIVFSEKILKSPSNKVD